MPAKGFRKTHCWRGHPMAGANLRIKPKAGGYIEHQCKRCHNDACQRRYRAKKKGRVNEQAAQV